MDKYNLYLEKSYDENVKHLKTEMARSKNIFYRLIDRFLYRSFVKRRLEIIKDICSETIHRDRILNHFKTRAALQAYIMIKHPQSGHDFYQKLKCYDICHFILRFSNERHDEDILEELFESCPSFLWENNSRGLFSGGKLIKNNKIILEDLRNLCSYDLIHNMEFK